MRGQLLRIDQARHALSVAESIDEAVDRVVLEDQIKRSLSIVRMARFQLLTLAPQSSALRVVEANVMRATDTKRTAQERLETVKIMLNQVNQYLFLLATQKAEDPNESFDPAVLTIALMQTLGPIVETEPTAG